MPSGLHRSYGGHHLHFITCSCYHRLPLLRTASSRDRLLTILDFNVWTTKKRVEKLRYMHRNPVKRGLVSSPEDFLDEAGPVVINPGWEKISFRVPAA